MQNVFFGDIVIPVTFSWNLESLDMELSNDESISVKSDRSRIHNHGHKIDNTNHNHKIFVTTKILLKQHENKI